MFKKLGAAVLTATLALLVFGCDIDLNQNDLDAYIVETMEKKDLPGLAASIVVDGKVAWSKGYGYANLEAKRKMTADTTFAAIGSVTKLLTGTALMIAEENGYLSLDDDIGGVLADAPFTIDSPVAPRTLPENTLSISWRHLVTHTSGILDSDNYSACAYYGYDDVGNYQNFGFDFFDEKCPAKEPYYHKAYPQGSPEGFCAGFLANYLQQDGLFYGIDNFADYTPGKYFEYSNVAAGLEGYLIGLAVGNSLDAYTRKMIFDPLKMNHTSWTYNDLNSEELAVPYHFSFRKSKLNPVPFYNLATWADGGLKTSANDLGRFLAAIMNRGVLDDQRILTEESVKEMLELTTYQTSGGEAEMQIGVHWFGDGKIFEDRFVYYHTGGDPGAVSYLYLDQENQLGVILLINRDDFVGGQRIKNILELMFQKGETLKKQS